MMGAGRRALPTARAAGVLAAVAVIAACEGSNLFVGEVAEEAPEISTLLVPASVETGETFTIQATGVASRGVKFIEVRVSGAATDSVRAQFDGTRSTETVTLPVTASAALGSQVVVDAFVQDLNGRNSGTRRATVTVTSVSTGTAGSN